MKEIDIEQWNRKEHFRFFARMDYPHFNLCFDLDISDFLAYVKKKNLSFYYSMVFASNEAANNMEEFRYRIRGEKVILHESLRPAFTDMDKGSDLFKMVAVDQYPGLEEFVSAAAEKSRLQKEYFPASDFIGNDDFIYYTTIPWISFTHISHTISLNKNDSVPRISWGRYYGKEGKTMLPFSVQVHHGFADGVHIGRYKDTLERTMKRICGF
jgi:chloramphenicol O-acetyltransferase type A